MQIINLEDEIWLPVQELDNKYFISNWGNVRNLQFEILQGSYNKKGYHQISFSLGARGKSKTFKVHRLVAIYFISNPLNKAQVNHLDGNPANNYYKNLVWATPKENISHSYLELNRKGSMKGRFNSDHHSSKSLIQTDKFTKEITFWDSISEVKRKLGYDNREISKCCRGLRDEYKNCYWKYKEKAQDL